MTTFVPCIHLRFKSRVREILRPRICMNAEISERAKQLFNRQQRNPLMDISSLDIEFSLKDVTTSRLPTPSTLSENQLKAVQAVMKSAIEDRAIVIARKAVLDEHAGITQVGGALYPEERAKACWRDLNCFLRDVGLFCAGGTYTEAGAQVIQEVYKELKVPLDAVKTGLDSMEKVIESECDSNQEAIEIINQAFEKLKQMIL